MKRILMVASLAVGLTIASCGNQSRSPNTNSPANSDTTSNYGKDTSTSNMNNDTSRNDTMRKDSSIR